jgi:hypothetical protein
MGKRNEIVGWHEIKIDMVNEDANCSLEVITPDADRISGVVTDPDVVAISWQNGSQSFTVMTSQIARVIVESLDANQMDDEDREELLETAPATTRSVQVRTRVASVSASGIERYWHLVWPETRTEDR